MHSSVGDTEVHDATMEDKHPPSMYTLEEIKRELTQLERMLTPLLNQVRVMQGKKPVIIPK